MKQALLNITIIIAGFLAVFGLSNYLEQQRKPLGLEIVEADLAFEPQTLKRYSLGFEGLMADYYWMSALQYVGRKVLDGGGIGSVQIDDLKPLNPRLLYPMLDTASTLDPDFNAVYSFGAVVLPAVNVEEAIKIAEKGIAAQPDNWRFYHQLGYIYWRNKDYKKAAAIYLEGSTKPGAQPWMRVMGLKLEAEGGDRELAREMYRQMLANAEDDYTKQSAQIRLMEADSLDERDLIRRALQDFQTKNNRCPANWREMFPLLRSAKLPNGKGLRFTKNLEPVDPSDAIYVLSNSNGGCDINIDRTSSKIPPQ
jgi:tetratricopeptide (TPR) repeat protein